jgi:hypothetical protein
MKVAQELQKNLVTPPEFAKMKNVNRTTVFLHVQAGKIEVILIGKNKHQYIDANEYKGYEFGPDSRRQAKLAPKKRGGKK